MKKCLVLLLLALTLQATRAQSSAPKREFRGAWIQCVNGQFEGLTPEAMRQKLTAHLDALARIHVNTIFFQVRPEADALYHSTMEPWSRFLTGTQGVAPQPEWDPLQWMITEAHKRNMELHAWINPYPSARRYPPVQSASRALLPLRRSDHLSPGVSRQPSAYRQCRPGHSDSLRRRRHPHGRLFLPLPHQWRGYSRLRRLQG